MYQCITCYLMLNGNVDVKIIEIANKDLSEGGCLA